MPDQNDVLQAARVALSWACGTCLVGYANEGNHSTLADIYRTTEGGCGLGYGNGYALAENVEEFAEHASALDDLPHDTIRELATAELDRREQPDVISEADRRQALFAAEFDVGD